MTHIGPTCKSSWLYLFAIKSYRNLMISIVFYCFRHLWRHNPQNIDITVLIFCIQPYFTMIHHLWKFHQFSISRTSQSAPPHVWSCSKSPMRGRVNFLGILRLINKQPSPPPSPKNVNFIAVTECAYPYRGILLRKTS